MTHSQSELKDTYNLFIHGETVPAKDDGRFKTLNPATEEPIAEVAAAQATDVDDAVTSAREGFNAWQALSPAERGCRLHAVVEEIHNHRDELATIECLDQGKPMSAVRASIDSTARYFEYFAGATDKIHGETFPMDGSWSAETIREPFGVSVQITPWNYPITQLARGTAPALAAGNAVIVKPAEQTPLSALRVAELAHQAGLPAGVLNVITGFGETAGEPLVRHPDTDVVTFTGSVETGQRVMQQAAKGIKQTTLELGGKSPAIVFPDADRENAIQEALKGILSNAGQTCNASSRLVVHEDVAEEFVERIVEEVEDYNVGAGIDDLDMGPLVSEEQHEKVLNYIEIGNQEGATLRTGGHPLDESGYFVEPTVFTDVTMDMRIANEEIFGPVLTVLTFDDEEEAIEIANATDYGLVAGIFSKDFDRINRIARSLETGHVYINEWFAGGVETPFGGVKQSGIGREKGLQSLGHYTQSKTISSKSFQET